MIYELWDVDVGNCIAYERSEAAMARLIRTLITHYGDAYADDLDLTVEDEAGALLGQYRGGALRRWADEVMRQVADPLDAPESRAVTAGRTAKMSSSRKLGK